MIHTERCDGDDNCTSCDTSCDGDSGIVVVMQPAVKARNLGRNRRTWILCRPCADQMRGAVTFALIGDSSSKRSDPVTQLSLPEMPDDFKIPDNLQKLAQLVWIAMTIGTHWRDQDGVNSSLLDRLAEATRP